MANKFLVPNSTNYADNNSWASSYLGVGGAGVPASGDDVYLGRSTAIPTAGLDALSPSGGALNSLTIWPDFRAGSPESAPLEISATTVTCASRAGRLGIKAGTNNIGTLLIATGAGARVSLTAGTITTIDVQESDLVILGAVAFTTLRARKNSRVMDYDGTAATLVEIFDRTQFHTERGAATIQAGDNTILRLLRDAPISTKLEVLGAATVLCQNYATIAALYQRGADSVVSPAGGTLTTVTNAYRSAGRFITQHGSARISIGTDNAIAGQPSVITDPGATYVPPFSEAPPF